MNRTTWLACLLGCALAAPATGASEPAPSMYAESDGVQYVMVFGNTTGSHAEAMGKALPFSGCTFAVLRPDLSHGIVHMDGNVGERTSLGAVMDVATSPRLAVGTSQAATATEPDHPAVPTDVSAWGTSHLLVDGEPFSDPVTGSNDTWSHLYLASDGYRNDATGAVEAPQPGQRELHLHVDSVAGAKVEHKPVRFNSPNEAGGMMLPNEAYSASYSIRNVALGGTADLKVQATATQLAGNNHLEFEVYSPSGRDVANGTLDPALMADDSAAATFALDEFGTYVLLVHGKVSMSAYSGEVAFTAPASFAMDFWWDQVVVGRAALDAYQDCLRANGQTAGTLSTLHVGRPPPPAYNLQAVLLGIGGTAVIVTSGIGLAAFAMRSSSFRRKVRSDA